MNVNIKFFDIHHFGFFLGDEKKFGDIKSILRDLNEWGKDPIRTIINTNTIGNDSENKKIYFYDWGEDSNTGDSVLVLWCEHDHNNHQIYGIDQMAKPGESVNIKTKSLDKNLIPGVPTYFWVIPEMNVVAIVKNTSSGGRKIDFENYLINYMANFSKFRVLDIDEKIIGFSESQIDSLEARKLKPRVKLYRKKDLNVEQEIIKNQSEIRKIVKEETFSNKFPDQRKYLERIFSSMFKNSPEFTKDIKIEHEIHYKPSIQEIYQIIERSHEDETCNFGFVFNHRKVMLKDLKLRKETELELNLTDGNIPKASALLLELIKKRNQLLDWYFSEKNDSMERIFEKSNLF